MEQAQPPSPSIPFSLAGTITGIHPLALLKLSNKELRFYSLSNKIKDFTITAILHNKIILSHNGLIYTLHLQQKMTVDTAPLTTSNTPNLSSKKVTKRPTNIQINRQLLKHISQNIQLWLNAVSLETEITDNHVSGYIIQAIGNIPFSSAIGLQQGDIIKSINGIHVGQSALFAKTTNRLLKNSDIYIKIERDHKINILHFIIND